MIRGVDMDEMYAVNRVRLRGVLAEKPHFSHESRGERFYQFPLDIQRLSGTVDRINIIAREQLLKSLEVEEASKISMVGELRSFNNRSGVGPKLVITVFARELYFDEGEDINTVRLKGTLCKAPSHRITPMGREISDLMLAVNRRYGRSDYLPCIVWGMRAREAGQWSVGTVVSLEGRIQSRKYIKNIDGKPVEKTAFEVSVIGIEQVV
jgi:single-strand DNA-binding protein